MRLERAAWKNIDFLVSGSNAASILVSLACSRTFPGALFGIRMRLCGLSGTRRGRLQSFQDVFKDALARHVAAQEHPRTDLDSILDVPEVIGDRFGWNLTSRAVESGASMCPNVPRMPESDVVECVKTN